MPEFNDESNISNNTYNNKELCFDNKINFNLETIYPFDYLSINSKEKNDYMINNNYKIEFSLSECNNKNLLDIKQEETTFKDSSNISINNISSSTKKISFVKSRWSKEDDKQLLELKNSNNIRTWNDISSYFPGSNAKKCAYRYKKLTDKDDNKKFSKEEDLKLAELVDIYGEKFNLIKKSFINKSECDLKLRYYQKLNHKLINFTDEEDQAILKLNNNVNLSNYEQQIVKRKGKYAVNKRLSILLNKKISSKNYLELNVNNSMSSLSNLNTPVPKLKNSDIINNCSNNFNCNNNSVEDNNAVANDCVSSEHYNSSDNTLLTTIVKKINDLSFSFKQIKYSLNNDNKIHLDKDLSIINKENSINNNFSCKMSKSSIDAESDYNNCIKNISKRTLINQNNDYNHIDNFNEINKNNNNNINLFNKDKELLNCIDKSNNNSVFNKCSELITKSNALIDYLENNNSYNVVNNDDCINMNSNNNNNLKSILITKLNNLKSCIANNQNELEQK